MTRNAFWGLCIGICMASTQSVAQKIENTNIQTDNQKNYTPSHINEITNGESLFKHIVTIIISTGTVDPRKIVNAYVH